LFHSREVDGLWVGAYEEPILERVVEALHLIKIHDPRRYRRLKKDMDRVMVTLATSSALAHFDLRLRACVLSEEFVGSDDSRPEMIAATIVHEATHARLHTCGISNKEPLRTRIEAACFRREIAFAAKLPNGELVRNQAERCLAFYADPAYWTDAAFEKRYPEELLASARRHDIPEWLVRMLLVVGALGRRFRRLLQALRRKS
jgi:hypothetical protein